MRKSVFYLLTLLLAITFFTSCEKDEGKSKVVNPIAQATYTGNTGLTLTYNGEIMIGKKVTYTPNASDPYKATLLLEGDEFDLSAALSRSGATFTTTSPIPGSASVTLDITQTVQGDQCSFSGNGSTDYCTFDYNGTVSTGAMTINLVNVKLKNATLSGSNWKLVNYDVENEEVTSPLVTNWTSTDSVSIEIIPGVNMKLPVGDVLTLAMRIPMIKTVDESGESTTASASEMIGKMLKNVAFSQAGCIQATYLESNSKNIMVSLTTLAMYVEPSNNKILLLLNPQQITETAVANKGIDKSSEMVKGMVPMVISMIPNATSLLKDGIPVNYEKTDDSHVTFYVDETLLKPLLQATVTPLLSNEKISAAINNAIAKNPKMSAYANMIQGVIKCLPDVIENTESMKIGLNFEKQ